MEVVKTFNFDIENNIMIVNNVKITVVGNYETPWFSGKEMCEALGYQNSKKTLLTNVKTKHKKTLLELKELGHINRYLSYHESKVVYINKEGLEVLLSKSKLVIEKGVMESLIDNFSLNLNLIHTSKEQEFIGAIKTVFAHYHHQTQFSIGKYRIDLYFINLKIAVECDELGHRDRDPVEEEERQRFIEDQLGCTFFRFNPDCKDFNIYVTINQLLKQIETKKVLENKKSEAGTIETIDEPLDWGEYRVFKNGREVSRQKLNWETMKEAEKVGFVTSVFEEYLKNEEVDWDVMEGSDKIEFVTSMFEEYLKSEYDGAVDIERKKFEQYMSAQGTKFNKRKMWSTLKEVAAKKSVTVKY